MISLNNIKSKIREILKIAIPITTAFVAIGLMGIVDTMVVGRYSSSQLAYMGIANAVFLILFTVPISLLQGVLIKSSQKYGARKFASIGKIYHEGKKYLIWLSVIFASMGFLGENLLKMLGQSPEMAENGGKILQVLSISLPFILINTNANFFLQSIKRPHIAMYCAVLANVLNIMINPVLVFGLFGAPKLEALGAAVATVVIRIFMATFVVIYIKKMQKDPKLNKRFGLNRKYKTWFSDSKTTRKVGYGIAVTTIAVNGSFSLMNVFAGWMKEEIMSVYVIISSMGGLLFMLFFSISQSTSIIVANGYGKKNRKDIITSIISGYIILITAIIFFLFLLYLFPNKLFFIFTNDETLIKSITLLIGWIIFELTINTLPLGIVSSLNGCGDVKIPTINQIFSFLILRSLAAYVLAIYLGWGIKGLLIGSSVGGLSSLILNYFRLRYIIKYKLYFKN